MIKFKAVVLNSDLRFSHIGLEVDADQRRVAFPAKPNQYIMFVNNARDRIKAINTMGTMLYYRKNSGKIGASDLDLFAESVGGKISFPKRIEASVRKQLTGDVEIRA